MIQRLTDFWVNMTNGVMDAEELNHMKEQLLRELCVRVSARACRMRVHKPSSEMHTIIFSLNSPYRGR